MINWFLIPIYIGGALTVFDKHLRRGRSRWQCAILAASWPYMIGVYVAATFMALTDCDDAEGRG